MFKFCVGIIFITCNFPFQKSPWFTSFLSVHSFSYSAPIHDRLFYYTHVFIVTHIKWCQFRIFSSLQITNYNHSLYLYSWSTLRNAEWSLWNLIEGGVCLCDCLLMNSVLLKLGKNKCCFTWKPNMCLSTHFKLNRIVSFNKKCSKQKK